MLLGKSCYSMYSCLALALVPGKCLGERTNSAHSLQLHHSVLYDWEVTLCIDGPSRKRLLTFWPTGFPVTIF